MKLFLSNQKEKKTKEEKKLKHICVRAIVLRSDFTDLRKVKRSQKYIREKISGDVCCSIFFVCAAPSRSKRLQSHKLIKSHFISKKKRFYFIFSFINVTSICAELNTSGREISSQSKCDETREKILFNLN